MAEIIGQDKCFRSTDKIRENRTSQEQRFLDNADQHKGKAIRDFKRKMGRTKAFGSLCPPGCHWPFPEKKK